jgi:hypothetical protein
MVDEGHQGYDGCRGRRGSRRWRERSAEADIEVCGGEEVVASGGNTGEVLRGEEDVVMVNDGPVYAEMEEGRSVANRLASTHSVHYSLQLLTCLTPPSSISSLLSSSHMSSSSSFFLH